MSKFGWSYPPGCTQRMVDEAVGANEPDEVFITAVQAHYLLFALDAYLQTSPTGDVTVNPNNYGYNNWQQLRDTLFAMHEHPEENE